MITTKKRLTSLALVLALLLLSVAGLSGCYFIDSGRMDEIEGTYELTHYSTDENEIEKQGITLYMTLRADGTGYYAYRDNDTALHYSALRCRYTQDTENAGHYSYVEVDFKGDGDYHKLGINARGKTLNSRQVKYKGNLFEGTLTTDYYIDVDFKKINRATDLSFIKAKLGEAPFIPHAALPISGYYYHSGVDSDETPDWETHDPFVYLYLKFDLIDGTGKAWYMLKADEVERTESFSVGISSEVGEGDGAGGTGRTYTLGFGSTSVKAYVSGYYVRELRIPYTFTMGGVEYDGYIVEYRSGAEDKTEAEILADIDSVILSYERQKDQASE
ncbi:MAG: hypothetical protein IKC32_00250 [Clostridia bacterium]|nr:hypothetical protein [Clostridia bacterium]